MLLASKISSIKAYNTVRRYLRILTVRDIANVIAEPNELKIALDLDVLYIFT